MVCQLKETIYIACHKPSWNPKHPFYQVIHVGAGNSNIELKGLRDDLGDSISHKNKHYCELTGLYWVWKNDKVSDIIGLCHYRRYFAFEASELQGLEKIEQMINPSRINECLARCDIILPKPYLCPVSLADHYCLNHVSADWNTMEFAVKKLFPDYAFSMTRVFNNHWLYPYNMFVMRRSLFHNYMAWLFTILDELDKRIIISCDAYQARVFGFLAERLLTLYVYKNNLTVEEKPIIFIR